MLIFEIYCGHKKTHYLIKGNAFLSIDFEFYFLRRVIIATEPIASSAIDAGSGTAMICPRISPPPLVVVWTFTYHSSASSADAFAAEMIFDPYLRKSIATIAPGSEFRLILTPPLVPIAASWMCAPV